MSGDWIVLTVLVTASLVACAVGARPINERQLTRWSIRYNVLVIESTKPWITGQLRRARTIRTVSFVLGINVGALPAYMNIIDVERAGSFSNGLTAQAPFAAAAFGAVIAEISLVRRPRGIRSATLATRRWADYVDRFWLVFIAGCLPVSAMAALFGTVRSAPYESWVWVGPGASLAAILVATVGVHIVVNRPAASPGNDGQRVDDALRADGAHHVVGAAVALAGVATCYSVSAALGGWWSIIPSLLTYAVLGNWNTIARSSPWNVDRARLQHA